MTDEGKYNYIQNETNSQNFENFQNTQNSNNYIYSPNQCNPYIDYNNIKSLADIPHKLIKQLSSNEFYIPFKRYRWLPLLFLLVSGGFCAGLILFKYLSLIMKIKMKVEYISEFFLQDSCL